MSVPNVDRDVDAVWRIESPRLIAGLARLTGEVGLAEDLAQDALVAALEKWPRSGVPDNPGAWLMATAKHRAIDLFRRNERLAQKQEEIARDVGLQLAMDGGDLLAKLGRRDEARSEFERAAELTENGRERKLLLERVAACAGEP